MDKKHIVILHGNGGTPKKFWFPYIKKQMEAQEEYKVSVPQLPGNSNPSLERQLPFVTKKFEFDYQTILIGHSSGVALALAILEQLDVKIAKAIFVAGYIQSNSKKEDPILKKRYRWDLIETHCKEFYTINSVDDPWGCDDKQGKKIFSKVGGTQIVAADQGHFGSDKYNQPYRQFPLLKSIIEL